MNNIETARNFVALHNTDIDAWTPLELDNERKLLAIHGQLIAGVYGNLENLGNNWHSIEISKHDSATGNPILFEFEI